MKKTNSLLIVLFITGQCMAQQKEEKSEPGFSSSYSVKWNPESLYFGKVSMFSEYNWKHKKSVTFGIGIPYNKSLTYKLDDEDRTIAMKTFSIMGGYRMYLGKKDMAGVYFEPYLKYVRNDASTTISADLNGETVDFMTTSKYSAFGVGAQLGVQFMIAKRIVFDFFFLGPEANTAKHKVVMRDITSSGSWNSEDAADAEQAIEDNIGDLPIIGKKLKITVDANAKTVSSDYKGFLPGFRAGMSVGFRF
jgi:Protein of unknown function (DUF3575)